MRMHFVKIEIFQKKKKFLISPSPPSKKTIKKIRHEISGRKTKASGRQNPG